MANFIDTFIDTIVEMHKSRVEDREEFLELVKDVINHEKIQEMKKYNHHSQTTCFTHSVHVAYYNYVVCKKLGLDVRAAVRAGLMHDLFLYDWHTRKPEPGEMLHGFEHPRIALRNARENFELSEVEADMIAKHMFPLTISLPKYKETAVIVMTDKFCSSCEVLDRFFKKKSRRLVHLAKLRKQMEKNK